MFRGTTPTITFNITTDLDLSEIEKLSIAIVNKQKTKKRIYEESDVVIDVEEKTITLGLSQEDTLFFNAGEIDIQLKLKMKNGKIYASKKNGTLMEDILDESVM